MNNNDDDIKKDELDKSEFGLVDETDDDIASGIAEPLVGDVDESLDSLADDESEEELVEDSFDDVDDY